MARKAAVRKTRITNNVFRKTPGKFGDEGLAWGEINTRNSVKLSDALNWYAGLADSDQCEKWLINWMGAHDYAKADIRHIKSQSGPAKDVTGKLSRMEDLGTQFTGELQDIIKLRVAEMLGQVAGPRTVADDDEKPKAEKPKAEVISIQDRIKAAAVPHIVAIDDEISSWYEQRKKKIEYSFYNYLQKHQPSSHVCKHVRRLIENRLAEHEAMMTFKDEQLNEAYEYLPLSSKREILKMLKAVLDDLDRFVGNSKAAKVRKPRAKKPVSVEKQIGKLKYQKEFAKLKIKSEAPANIIGASQVWIFNTKTNQITVYNGLLGGATLGVKGTSIIGFDEATSVKKKVRKPELVIKQVLDAGKIQLRKLIETIKCKPAEANGRVGADCVILRTVKG